MNPKYPIYVISKGRWQSRQTSKALEAMNVPYHIVIESQEQKQYALVINPSKTLVLPFSNLGQGSIPTRNWVWEHAIKTGAERHWILDDNIRWFARVHQNKKIRVDSGVCFAVTEEFVDRYENVAMAGLQYEALALARHRWPPFVLNHRVYSCILLKNDLPHRWRGAYNEDTDLSLRILKDGWCTILMNAFVCAKTGTMTMKGGNTESLYQANGRLKMAQLLQQQHPDVVQIKRRWGRWQHVVDYRPFKRNRLIKKRDVVIPTGVNNYGMVLANRQGEK